MLILLLACTGEEHPQDSENVTPPLTVPWSGTHAPLAESSPAGRAFRRGIIHLHSHYSHDACDGEPMPDGTPDEDCLADLRAGLCATAMDFAFVTDHPSYAAWAPYNDLLLQRDNDTIVDGIANRMDCGDGHTTLLMPGIEDELMPVGLERHVAETAEENDQIYNQTDAEAITADIDAGAVVLQAHTESKSLEELIARQSDGLAGVELFNLHAMFAPDIREEYLGLDSFGYLNALAPFMLADSTAEPDLAFLAVVQEQGVSLEKWDALSTLAPTVGVAGTDAHQNVLPAEMSDGERMDSYRRMMIWFSNILLVDGDGPEDYQDALRAQRAMVVFESLGTPQGFLVSYGELEMGGTAALGDALTVSCPTLTATSPQEGDPPEISVTVFKDGQPWAEGCDRYPVTEPGVYRVRVDIVPHHLRSFLGEMADDLIHTYPWIYSNAFRIGL